MMSEELNEIIGKVIGGAAKLAAKGIRRGLVNKQGNLRVSRAGRNDARQAKIDAIEKKKKEEHELYNRQKFCCPVESNYRSKHYIRNQIHFTFHQQRSKNLICWLARL